MRCTYFVAASLDGFIADSSGGVEFLKQVDSEGEDYGYQEFYSTVDALMMGAGTYRSLLKFGTWPYAGKPTYLLSNSVSDPLEGVIQTNEAPARLLSQIYGSGKQHVWLVGGGKLASTMLSQGLITEIVLSLVPVMLGTGIRLFSSREARITPVTLKNHRVYDSGLIQMHYHL
ncbi:MAG: dihydrofolate reductase [Candidatus Cloacimonetes bacterium]|nr:dihydrofolate reductase [Candidatus Cloacimonadota bacterium]